MRSAAVYGIDALLVDIEVNLRQAAENDQSPNITIVGLPDTAVRESRERIRAAINNSGYFFPIQKITVNLAPADVRKEGASFDLPSALGILGANGDLTNGQAIENTLSVGELSLDGRVRPIRGALSIALAARENGITNILVPEENAREAAVVQGVNVFPIRDLRQAANLVQDLDSGGTTTVTPLKLDIAELKSGAVSYTHLDVYKRQAKAAACDAGGCSSRR